jgi:hypothetical protein
VRIPGGVGVQGFASLATELAGGPASTRAAPTASTVPMKPRRVRPAPLSLSSPLITTRRHVTHSDDMLSRFLSLVL